MERKSIIILHDLNGKPYYEAVEYYARKNDISVKYYESSILKLFIRDIVKGNFGRHTITRSVKNLIFRFKVPFIKDKTIILGMAPYDFRIIWYSFLLKNNNLLYNTSHPFWGKDDRSPRKYGILTPIFKIFWKRFLKHPKLKIVPVTKTAMSSLKKNFEIDGKIIQIYHTVDTLKFKKNIEEKIYEDKLKILFVGKLIYEKGLDTIVKLIEEMDSDRYEFSIVGDGSYRKKLKYIFKRENVRYYGWISDKNKLSIIYKKHHIFLNPSIKTKKWQELFGIVNIEAMASGLVVIASNHIGPIEIIRDGINGFLVEEENSKEIANIIMKLNKNRKLLKKIMQNAVKTSRRYDIKLISKKWEKIIN